MTPAEQAERERLVAAEQETNKAFWDYSNSLPSTRKATAREMRRLFNLDKAATNAGLAVDAFDAAHKGEG